ncbi:MAG: outer membrane beta-barrel protein [Bacteroidales bacterium]|nr:outer membrane beta-barrel protein [Bacteroidales bacterium]MBN2820000.1 outer membrane beta-barrel protein [Bacteroidales bacterium]
MKKTGLLLIVLSIAALLNGQTIKLQGGTSISTLHWQLHGVNIDPLYDEPLIGYSVFGGLDYFDMQYFNLSSNIGMIRKGGKEEIQLYFEDGQPSSGTYTDKPTLNYLSINTAIDLRYRIKEKFSPFISVGPRVDFLVNYSRQFDGLEDLDGLKKSTIGLIFGGGLKYNISSLQFGIQADYYLDFTKVADWTIESTGNSGEVTANTFAVNLTIGYKIK